MKISILAPLLAPFLLHASEAQTPLADGTLRIADLVLSRAAFQEPVFLHVNKDGLRAELRSLPSDTLRSEVLREFTVAIGKVLGDKEVTGDNKTPEGIYFANGIKLQEDLPPKYGPRAITLNYPNPFDHWQGKTGYGIWLHGVIKDERIEEANVTEGCVAFYNSDILKLVNWLRPHHGLVMISKNGQGVNDPADLSKLRDSVQTWLKAWADRDMDAYISSYSEDFRRGKMRKKDYSDYKRRVFNSYKEMIVKVSEVRYLTHPKYAVAVMDQDFHGDKRFSAVGRKILYMHKDATGEYRILREEFDTERVAHAKLSALLQEGTGS
jgi:murein L,D-transpeptidase YafK